MEAMASFTSMSPQALESARIRAELKDLLLGPAGLYERLRERTKGVDPENPKSGGPRISS